MYRRLFSSIAVRNAIPRCNSIKRLGGRLYGTTVKRGGDYVPLGWRFWASVFMPFGLAIVTAELFMTDNSNDEIPKEFLGIYLPMGVQGALASAYKRFKKGGDVKEFRDSVNEVRDKLTSWGYDPISPQITACLLLVTRAFSERSDKLTIDELRDQFNSLIKKPHVGESIVEESNRLKAAFYYVSSLITKDSRLNGEEVVIDPLAFELSEWALRTYHDPPYYLSMRWTIIKSDILAENPYILDKCLKLLEEKII